MIYITTDASKVNIFDVEDYFKSIEDKSIFTQGIYEKIIKDIDHSVFIDKENLRIQTPFGETVIDNMCTSCKAVLLAVYMSNKKEPVSIVECGTNSIEYMFELSKEIDVYVYINCSFVISMDRSWDDYKAVIEGELIEGFDNIYDELNYLTDEDALIYK